MNYTQKNTHCRNNYKMVQPVIFFQSSKLLGWYNQRLIIINNVIGQEQAYKMILVISLSVLAADVLPPSL